MFAIPGIAALMIFILARPQEFLPALQRVPFLHLFTALAVLGWVIDMRLRRLHPVGTPVLPWAAVFLLWSVITCAVLAPDAVMGKTIELAILFALYGTISHGVQRFRTFQVLAGTLAATSLFIAFVCFHQGVTDKQCVAGQERSGSMNGIPDGRFCEKSEDCHRNIPEDFLGWEFRCEHVGMFGTYSQEERVRYRGELQDPNEVSLVVVAGAISMLIAFIRRKRGMFSRLFCVVGIFIGLGTIFLSKSRGGQAAVMLVFFIYMVRRFGLIAFLPAGLMGLPIMLLGGRGGEAADASTQQRYEAWATGLKLFQSNPVFGCGSGQFTQHHYLTAHNSFVLALAECGFFGLFLFTTMVYLTLKSLISGLVQLRKVPGSDVAQVWGMALLASWCAMLFQINTLSFTYHSVLWIFFGLTGAWAGAIRHHQPDFVVKMTWRDIGYVVGGCIVYVALVLPLLLKYKGEL